MLDLSCFKSGFRKCGLIVGLGFQQGLQIKTSESADFCQFPNLLTSEIKNNVENFKLTYKFYFHPSLIVPNLCIVLNFLLYTQ